MRLGVYADLAYRRSGDTLTANRAFVKFVTSLPPRVDEVVLFGRLEESGEPFAYELPREGVRLVALPHYGSLTDVGGLARALAGSRRAFARELPSLDAVWLFGPHPIAVAFARAARRRGLPVFLGVRQDLPAYVAPRLPSRWWLWALGAAHGLEQAWRLLARRLPTVVVGEELARAYRGGAPVLATGFSLIRESELASLEDALTRPWDGEIRVLTVGRLDPEKNPMLLPEILAALRRRSDRWRLAVVGEGPLEGAVRRRSEQLDVGDALELLGYVPNGPRLWEQYRAAHAFLHVSLTEGLPQVLFEAQASALPVVATDVGGVRAAVGDTALLVPPRDAGAAVAALERLAHEPDVRERLIRDGLDHARRETLDAQLDRVADFFRANLH